jgi:hypothetical protein
MIRMPKCPATVSVMVVAVAGAVLSLASSPAAAAPGATAPGEPATQGAFAGTIPSFSPGVSTSAAAAPCNYYQEIVACANRVDNREWWNLFWRITGDYAGYAMWSRNPVSGDPGDAIRASDGLADGWGVEARLNEHDGSLRIASTRGHDSPYTSPWKTGNLPEGRWYELKGCLVKGDRDLCSNWLPVYSG